MRNKMKTENRAIVELDWPDVAKALFTAKGITAGHWQVAMKLRFAGTTAEFREASTGETEALPTGLVGINAIALMPVDGPGPMVFDAAASTSSRTPGKKAAMPPPATKMKPLAGVPKTALPKPSVKPPRIKA